MLTWLKTLASIKKAHLYNFYDKSYYEYIQNLILQRWVKWSLQECLNINFSWGRHAVVVHSELLLELKREWGALPGLYHTCFKKSLWLFLSGRIRGLSVPVTPKPLKNDTAKFAKYLPWCSDSSGGENVRKKTPCRVVWDWHERAVSFSWAGCCSKALSLCCLGLAHLGLLPACWLTPGYSCQVQGKATPSFHLWMCSAVGIRCYSGFCYCVMCNVAMKLPFYIDFLHPCMNHYH